MSKIISYFRSKKIIIISFYIGLIMGVIYSFGGLLIDILVTLDIISTSETPGLSIGTIYAFGALIGMPLITGFIGFTISLFGVCIKKLIANCNMK